MPPLVINLLNTFIPENVMDLRWRWSIGAILMLYLKYINILLLLVLRLDIVGVDIRCLKLSLRGPRRIILNMFLLLVLFILVVNVVYRLDLQAFFTVVDCFVL